VQLLVYIPFLIQELLSCRFEKYVEYALDVPMYFVYRNSQYVDCSGLSFRVNYSATSIATVLNCRFVSWSYFMVSRVTFMVLKFARTRWTDETEF